MPWELFTWGSAGKVCFELPPQSVVHMDYDCRVDFWCPAKTSGRNSSWCHCPHVTTLGLWSRCWGPSPWDWFPRALAQWGVPRIRWNVRAIRKLGAGTIHPSSMETACGAVSLPLKGWREERATGWSLVRPCGESAQGACSPGLGCTPSLEASNLAPATPCQLGEPKTQDCSGSESPSNLEGEEIDVVTVKKSQSLCIQKPVTITAWADPLDPCMKHFHISIHQQQHNYAAHFPPERCFQEEGPQRSPQEETVERKAHKEKQDKKDEELVSPPPLESEAPPSCHPRPVSSDTEDLSKRKNHNFLEHKSQNDLCSQFLALRDQVPTLASYSKAPKVVILRKAFKSASPGRG
ncbi:L-myc-1 proto-oncogene protein [Heterocephalus glaber]|uniref:L-myc-1 proto-oncogene protein n=1 Tax=Heterocephalus glaber TaxID=10181 RepID=G5BP28_HETGA|nr:L-myc-1 proto-oncogene protein [Heterocephalus glaber]